MENEGRRILCQRYEPVETDSEDWHWDRRQGFAMLLELALKALLLVGHRQGLESLLEFLAVREFPGNYIVAPSISLKTP